MGTGYYTTEYFKKFDEICQKPNASNNYQLSDEDNFFIMHTGMELAKSLIMDFGTYENKPNPDLIVMAKIILAEAGEK